LTFNRLSIPAPARKHARVITLSAAAIAAVATPSLASAATLGSTHAPAAATAAVAAPVAKVNAAPVGYATTTSNSTSSSSSTTTYTVVAGDTLSGIAQSKLGNGNDYQQLFSLNENRSEPGGQTFTDPNLIGIGWTLSIPASGSSSSTAATTDSSSTTSSDSSSSSTASTATTTASTSSSGYADDLNGWINQAISILSAHGYTVSYNAIYQTAMNESSGNPDAENNWDSNAAAGNPSIGLMQTTQTTFDAYALPGYDDITNPVDNIIAAAIYAQATYGGLDNVVAARCGGSCWYGY
jgi:LysM repeat protein